MKIINIAKDFSEIPGGRTRESGVNSGEEFREDFLEKYIDNNPEEKICINLDGGHGYACSFLDEVFGGLAIKYGSEYINSKLSFISSEEPHLIDEIKEYINEKN